MFFGKIESYPGNPCKKKACTLCLLCHLKNTLSHFIPILSLVGYFPPVLWLLVGNDAVCFFDWFRDNDFDYLEFRLWIGLWSGFLCLILVATDASFLVQYFTRFTEEGFSALISFIFIYDAFKKMIKLAHHHPINSGYDIDLVTQYGCHCSPPDGEAISDRENNNLDLCLLQCFCINTLFLLRI